VQLERGGGALEVLQRRVALTLGVVEDQVALAEGAALGVLAS
jgi:hypothetical protein